MELFNTSLIREKIVISDKGAVVADETASGVNVIRSNRVSFSIGHPPAVENIVVRAQNMHSTLRFAGKLLQAYGEGGLLLGRKETFSFLNTWQQCISEYEQRYNPGLWAAVYINGEGVFRTVQSPFMDVVEKCALVTPENYYAAKITAEKALERVGRASRLNQVSNIAATITDKGSKVECGVMYRADNSNTIFKVTVAEGGNKATRLEQSIGFTAAYLEVFSLYYLIDRIQAGIRRNEIPKTDPAAQQIRYAIVRKNALNKAINAFEKRYQVVYTPKKPQFVL